MSILSIPDPFIVCSKCKVNGIARGAVSDFTKPLPGGWTGSDMRMLVCPSCNGHTIPAGFMLRGDGTLVPESKVKPLDKLRDDLVQKRFAKAEEVSELARRVRDETLSEVEAFVQLSVEQYGAKYDGRSVTITSFDGLRQIQVERRALMHFNEQLAAAQSLIGECIDDWAEGSSVEIRALVDLAFRPNKAGQVSVQNVMRLRQLEVKDERWQRAMQALLDAIQSDNSVQYVRFYSRPTARDKFALVNFHPGGAR